MRKFIIATALALVAAFTTTVAAPPAQSHTLAYTFIHQNYQGLNRIINLQCRDGSWHAIQPGMTSKAVCGSDGWVMRVWVDSDVNLYARNRCCNGGYVKWGSGIMVAAPGNFDVYVAKSGSA